MYGYKKLLLGATAAAALLGAGSTASAFEVVDWTWTDTITSTGTLSLDVRVSNDPTGLVQVEKLQMHFGDLNATSTVDGVSNNPASAGGTAVIDETFTFTGLQDDQIDPSTFPETVGTGGTGGLSATLVAPSTLDEGSDEFTLTVDVNGEVTVPAEDAIDAIDLPKVANSATAVANNQSIETDTALYLHDAQFAAGGFNPTCGGGGEISTSSYGCPDALGFIIGAYGVTVLDDQLEDINEHTSIAGLMTVAAATGFIEPASINATANVSNILNAYVENSATAVTNNASFEIASADPENHIMVADLTQWGYSNNTATASVTNVEINDYTGFGAAGLGGGLNEDIVPIVSSSATAVGNNLSIKVGVPEI